MKINSSWSPIFKNDVHSETWKEEGELRAVLPLPSCALDGASRDHLEGL